MHEFGLVDQLIAAFLAKARAAFPSGVRRLRVRYGPGLDEESVRQAFRAESAGTPLAGAELALEAIPAEVVCSCGTRVTPFPREHSHADGETHDHGLPYMDCGRCGTVHAIPSFDVLEIVDAG